MRVVLGPLVEDARGSVGGLTFSRAGGQPYVKVKSRPGKYGRLADVSRGGLLSRGWEVWRTFFPLVGFEETWRRIAAYSGGQSRQLFISDWLKNGARLPLATPWSPWGQQGGESPFGLDYLVSNTSFLSTIAVLRTAAVPGVEGLVVQRWVCWYLRNWFEGDPGRREGGVVVFSTNPNSAAVLPPGRAGDVYLLSVVLEGRIDRGFRGTSWGYDQPMIVSRVVKQ